MRVELGATLEITLPRDWRDGWIGDDDDPRATTLSICVVPSFPLRITVARQYG